MTSTSSILLLPLQIEQNTFNSQHQDVTLVVLSRNTVAEERRPGIAITNWAMTVGCQQATRQCWTPKTIQEIINTAAAATVGNITPKNTVYIIKLYCNSTIKRLASE